MSVALAQVALCACAIITSTKSFFIAVQETGLGFQLFGAMLLSAIGWFMLEVFTEIEKPPVLLALKSAFRSMCLALVLVWTFAYWGPAIAEVIPVAFYGDSEWAKHQAGLGFAFCALWPLILMLAYLVPKLFHMLDNPRAPTPVPG